MVAIINEEQRNLLRGDKYDGVQYFNVDVFDVDNNCVIGEEEISMCINSEFQWVKSLELIEYKQKPINL